MEFGNFTDVPIGLIEIRDGFNALNQRLENELKSSGKVLQMPVINTVEDRKEAA